MNPYFNQPDGEVFADVPKAPVPTADTWEKLSVNQLIEVKNELTMRAYQYADNQAMLKPLHAGIARIDALISRRLAAE